MRRFLVLLFAAAALPGAAPAGKMELPPVQTRYTIRGAYDIRKSGVSIGREDFIRTSLSNNTAIYESVFEAVEDGETVVSGNNRLEVEEDSSYPRSYYTQRRTRGPQGETSREIAVEMFANVAVVSETQDGEEVRRDMTLPTGCLFVEGNTAAHVAVALDRYDRRAGGRQTFRAFDPMGLRLTDLAVESAGDSVVAETGGAGEASAPTVLRGFKYQAAGAPSARVWADPDGRVVSITVGRDGIEYVLVSFERASGPAEKAK